MHSQFFNSVFVSFFLLFFLTSIFVLSAKPAPVIRHLCQETALLTNELKQQKHDTKARIAHLKKYCSRWIGTWIFLNQYVNSFVPFPPPNDLYTLMALSQNKVQKLLKELKKLKQNRAEERKHYVLLKGRLAQCSAKKILQPVP